MKDWPEAEENIKKDGQQYGDDVDYIAVFPHPEPATRNVLTAGQNVRCNGENVRRRAENDEATSEIDEGGLAAKGYDCNISSGLSMGPSSTYLWHLDQYK